MVHSAACRIKKAAVPNRVMAVPEKAVLGQIYGKSSSDHKASIFLDASPSAALVRPSP